MMSIGRMSEWKSVSCSKCLILSVPVHVIYHYAVIIGSNKHSNSAVKHVVSIELQYV